MKGKKTIHPNTPSIQLPEILKQLEMINMNLFQLKAGCTNLIEAVEKGNLNHAQTTIEIFDLKQLIDNLTTKC